MGESSSVGVRVHLENPLTYLIGSREADLEPPDAEVL